MEVLKSKLRKFQNYDLSDKEIDSFECKINDELMNQSYENYKFSENLSTEMFVPGYLEMVQRKKKSFLENLPQSPQIRKGSARIRIFLAAAASLAILLTSVFMFVTIGSDVSSDQLVSIAAIESLNLDHISTIERGASKIDEANDLISLYKSGEYAEFLALINQAEESEMITLLKARGHFHMENYEESMKIFNTFNVETFPQRDALLWSLIEIELQLENMGNAKKYLNQIISGDYPNADKARVILKTIK